MKTSDVDREALERAVDAFCSTASGRRQFERDRKLGWNWAAREAARAEQLKSLKWSGRGVPPCDILNPAAELKDANNLHARQAAARLLCRMLAAELSRWEPDPVKALAERETAPAA
jgi:hypothetical protein